MGNNPGNSQQTPGTSIPAWLIPIILSIAGFGTGIAPLVSTGIEDIRQKLGGLIIRSVTGLLTGVVVELIRRRVARFTDKADANIDLFFSRYGRRYLKHLYYRHRDFDVKGLSTQNIYNLELENVFVELSMMPSAHASPDPIQVDPIPQELIKDAHPIWDYLRSPKLGRLVIIGAPGSGKTTLLKYVALALHKPWQASRKYHVPRKLPILLFLREHSQSIQSNANYFDNVTFEKRAVMG